MHLPHFAPAFLFRTKWDRTVDFACPGCYRFSLFLRTLGLQDRELIPGRSFQLSIAM